MSTAMRALVHNQAKQTLILRDVPFPTPDFSVGEHLVKVYSAGLVGTELLWPRPINESVPGVDVVGRIMSAPASSKFQPGSIVFARTMYPRPGSAREYSIVLEQEMALIPKSLSYIEAAAVPVSALTALQALEHVGESTRVLVNGASGGVGIWAVQVAHLLGAYVIGVTSAANADFVRSLGADEIIDYRNHSWAETKDVDLAFDCVGRAAAEPIWHTVKQDGRFVTIVPPADMNWKMDLDTPAGVTNRVKGTFFLMRPSGEDLSKIAQWIDDGHCKPVVDSVYSLEDGAEAFKRVDSGRTIGKVILKVAEE